MTPRLRKTAISGWKPTKEMGAQRILEIEPGLKAVVSSGYSEDPVMTYISDYGFSAAVVKP